MNKNKKLLLKISKNSEKLKYFLEKFPKLEKIDGLKKEGPGSWKHIKKYYNLYIKIIAKCIDEEENTLSSGKYYEKHHMIPKSMGGEDVSDNILALPVRHHIILHLILGEAFPNEVAHKYALKMIFNSSSKEEKNNTRSAIERSKEVQKHFSTRFIAKIREENCRVPKEKHPNFGKHLPLEVRQKISASHKGKKLSEETKKKMSLSRSGEKAFNYGKKLSKETLRKLSEAHKGAILTEEHKKKLSIALSGERNPNYGKKMSEETKRKIIESKKNSGLRSENPNAKKVRSPEGKIYNCILDAVDDSGIPKGTLTKWLRKIHRPDSGWEYVN